MGPGDAKMAAVREAKKIMSTLAGLHNPDLIAGGKDIIGSFGDRQVNSSIGPQWRNKIQALKKAAEQVATSKRQSILINVYLHIC